MSESSSPTQIARETLRRLALNRMQPTPENFQKLYLQISGVETDEVEKAEEFRLRLAINALLAGKKSADLVTLLNDAVAERTWPKARAALSALAQAQLNADEKDANGDTAAPAAGSETTGQESDNARAVFQARVFRDLIAYLLESSVVYQLSENDDLLQEGRMLAGRVRRTVEESAVTMLVAELKRFFTRMEARAEDVRELRDGMHRLLRLLVDNVSELIVEDTWITHELDTVRELVARPAAGSMIEEAEQYLKDVLLKQGVIKSGLREAKATLKNLASSLFDHLGTISADAEGYGSKIEGYSKRIRESDDIASLNDVLGELLRDTSEMRNRASSTVKDVADVRARAHAAEQRIVELEADLVKVGEQVSQDHLTRALNRRGFEDAFVRESALAARHRRSLCLAVLDIDNFKSLNDAHGHQAGDRALVHLASLIKDTLRPSDSVARIGGEEFVLLLPEIELEAARDLVVRLQRELTKRIFMHENDRVLITFSAGVTRWRPDESRESAVARADAAQYKAKCGGKNKVVVAEDPVVVAGTQAAPRTGTSP